MPQVSGNVTFFTFRQTGKMGTAKLNIVRWNKQSAWATSSSWRRSLLARELRKIITLSATDSKRLARRILDQEVFEITFDEHIDPLNDSAVRHIFHILESLGAELVIDR